MRIISKTLITKGILGCRKAWSIATKGILDLCPRGAEPRNGVHGFKISFILTGKKQYCICKQICLIGCKEFKYAEIYSFLGKKLNIYCDEFDLLGRKLLEFDLNRKLVGFIEQQLVDSIDLFGKKLTPIGHSTRLHGAMVQEIKTYLEIASAKAIPEQLQCNLHGGKELHFSSTKRIQGKKDISPIFELFDL